MTVALIGAVLGTAMKYQVFSHELSLDVGFRYGFSGRALSMGHWSTLLTSQLLTRNAFMAVSIAFSLALMLGVYEAVAGSWRAAIVAVVTAVAGPLMVAGGLAVGSAIGNNFAGHAFATLDYGASAVTAGAGGALVAVLGMRRLRWIAAFWVALGLLAHHQLADWEHVGSFATGYGLGSLLGAAPPVGGFRRVTSRLTSRAQHPALVVLPGLVVAAIAGSLIVDLVVPPRVQYRYVAQAPGAGPGSGAASAPNTVRTALPANASPPQLVSVSYPTPSLGGTRQAFVILPAGYDTSTTRYPVIEMLHGQPGSPNEVITGLDPLGLAGQSGIPQFIGIVPDGRGPAVFDSQFADTSKQQVGTALSVDLRAWVDKHYRTSGHWSITGLSSGGYGAAYLGSRVPALYSSVCALSGNFTPKGAAFRGESSAVIRAATPILNVRSSGPRTLLIAGASDHGSVRDAQRYAGALSAAGQSHVEAIVSGGHNWVLWHREFPRCLRFVLADSSAPSAVGHVVTASAPVSAPGSAPGVTTAMAECVTDPPSMVTVSGSRAQRFEPLPVAGSTIDALTATWLQATNYPVTVRGGSDACWVGGRIFGTYPWNTPWSVYHRTAAFGIDAASLSVVGVRVHNYGDAFQVRTGGTNFSIVDAHVSFNHDDCVQNDNLYSGTVRDGFFDGCYVGFSARPSAQQVAEGRNNTWTISNNLVRLQPMPTVYKGRAPGTGGFFKWDEHQRGPQLVVRDNVFRADQRPNHQTLGLPSGYRVTCSNNVVVWLGKGPFPEKLPKCFRITTDRRVWDRAVATWQRNHPMNP